eukprot:7376248-Prymnesium_polylepis.1
MGSPAASALPCCLTVLRAGGGRECQTGMGAGGVGPDPRPPLKSTQAGMWPGPVKERSASGHATTTLHYVE